MSRSSTTSPLLESYEVPETFALVANVLASQVMTDLRFASTVEAWDEAMHQVIARARRIGEHRRAGVETDVDIDKLCEDLFEVTPASIRVLRKFVIELGLPYPWLAVLLSGILRLYATALATGETFPIGLAAAAPPLEPGEDIASYVRRIREARPAGKRRPKGGGARLAQYVGWFYRVRVKHPGDSVRAIAKEIARGRTGVGGNGRADVDYGIKRVLTILHSSTHHYAPTPRPN